MERSGIRGGTVRWVNLDSGSPPSRLLCYALLPAGEAGGKRVAWMERSGIRVGGLEKACFVTPADLFDRCANARRVEVVIE
ncbi:hypothetical protein JCM17961_25480 [Endothiovibrio diazotrophicus]